MENNRKKMLTVGCRMIRNSCRCSFIGLSCVLLISCNSNDAKSPRIKKDYIKKISGENDSIPVRIAQKGEVLIAYSDCYTCHKEGKKSVGPAFTDIARRYPVQEAYVSMLAQKIIVGGSGAWGQAVMTPHPDVSIEDAKIMVKYILSLKK